MCIMQETGLHRENKCDVPDFCHAIFLIEFLPRHVFNEYLRHAV